MTLSLCNLQLHRILCDTLKNSHIIASNIMAPDMTPDMTKFLYGNCTQRGDLPSGLNGKLYELIDKRFVDEFITVVTEHSQKRTPKYPVEYYLYHIILVLSDVVKWSSLAKIRTVIDKRPFHYKTIYAKHLEWSREDLYKKTYVIMNTKYHSHLWKDATTMDLLIDTTSIYNNNGQENIGYGGNPKKQESRISVISDVDKNVYSVTLVKTIQRTETKRTHPSDSRTVEASVVELKHYYQDKEINLTGDKGYATSLRDRDELKRKYNVKLIYPNRSNQRERTPEEYKPKLAVRYKVEHVFADLKKFNRICIRRDNYECTYMGFVYLAIMVMFKF